MELGWIDSKGVNALKEGRFDDWARILRAGWLNYPHLYEHLRTFCPPERFLDATKWLLAKGWDPSNPDMYESPLVVAQRYGTHNRPNWPSLFRLLIDQGRVDINDSYQAADDAGSPLAFALRWAHTWAVHFLIYEGARWPSNANSLEAWYQQKMYKIYRAMGHCRLAQRATVRALVKREPRLRDVATHLIGAMVWNMRSAEEWQRPKE